MATLDYIDVPTCATRLQPQNSQDSLSISLKPAPKVHTSPPRPPRLLNSNGDLAQHTPPTPSKTAMTFLPHLLLSPAINIPSTPSSANPRSGEGALLSTRDPLSIPITTANFRRFVARVGPVFWLQDRIEEILMWKKGWKVTTAWMAVYAFICYFPRLVLLIPNLIFLSVMLSTHPSYGTPGPRNAPAKVPNPPSANASEGTGDWQANIQAIQNLMGAFSDIYDIVIPALPYITHASPYSPVLLTLTLLTTLFSSFFLIFPFRSTLLVIGLTPFLLSHPFTRTHVLPALPAHFSPSMALRARLIRAVDDDMLTDKHWRSEMREVELWENERWGTDGAGWGKANLRSGERVAWTRGRDGWSGVMADGSNDVSSDLTFSLAPGWMFVETEDWRPDLEVKWISPTVGDKNGWVYTNDAWLDPRPFPVDEWKTAGSTRRRRWVRRVYYCPDSEGAC